MNKEQVKLSVKDLLDKIKEIKGESGTLVLRKNNYTEKEVKAIREEVIRYLNKINRRNLWKENQNLMKNYYLNNL